ncbi:MAG: hypothetical protein K6A38_01220 [Lachnospiraceae bacterium]|nr:hypothetical protein [Lachnospiraceae bacterium]
MKNDEIRFAEILEDIKYVARASGGYIKEDEVTEAFEELDLSKEQFSMVFDYLKKNNIGIGEPLTDDDMLSGEERNLLEEYKAELDGILAISESEKEAYSISAMAGDEDAKQKLMFYFLPKVVEISKLYSSQGVLLEDLIGEGNLALTEGLNMLDAIEKPDEIEGMLIKLVMDAMESIISDTVNENTADSKIVKKVNEVADAAKKLSEELGRKVTVTELSEESGLSVKKINEAIRLSGRKIEDIDYPDESI